MRKSESLEKVFKGKKIFITGHTGFKGTWLSLMLYKLGAEVKGYALKPEEPKSLFDQVGAQHLFESVIGDIRDKKKLTDEIVKFQPDFIFHLAAQPLVRFSYHYPLYTYETNVMGTAYLLEAVRNLTHPCQVVVITTDKVYENQEWSFPYRESDALGGVDPYSSSKACSELVTSSYRQSYFPPEKYTKHKKSIATARAGNVIGGGDWAKDRIVPDIIKSLKKGKPVTLRNPNAIRPWQHVMEALSGYLHLAAAMYNYPKRYAQDWNFGPIEVEFVTVEDLVKQAINYMRKGEYQVKMDENQPHETQMLRLDSSKALQLIKWRPVLSARQAIEWTMKWYSETEIKKKNAREVTFMQIEEYFSNIHKKVTARTV